MVQVGGILSFYVDEELIFPGMAVDGPAFDLEQVHTVFCKRLERSEQRAGTMREAHRERRFAGFVREPGGSFFFWHKKNKAREVFGIVLDTFGKNHAVIMFGGAAPGDGGV